MVVPPYEPVTTAMEATQDLTTGPKMTIADYSEDTLFNKNDAAAGSAQSVFESVDSPSSLQPVLQAIVSTGASAGCAEYAYGFYRGRASPSSSPFAFKTVYSPFLRRDSDSLVVRLFRATQQQVPTANVASAPAIRSVALAAALSTSTLFGTKVAAQHYFSVEDSNGRINTATSASFLSSVVAGGVVGFGHLASLQHPERTLKSLSQHHPQQALAAFSAQQTMLGRHVLAASLYFSTYDVISSFLTQSHKTTPSSKTGESIRDGSRKSTIGILAGGAIAGCAHAAALNYHCGIWRLIPAATRAAPFHALVFYAFESMKDGIEKPLRLDQ